LQNEDICERKKVCKKIVTSMELLLTEANLVSRLEDGNCQDKQLVQDFICAFCISFVVNPVMCGECEKVFCLECQLTYYK
jgi:hypothetical protein